jgi:hypothetical protein
MNRLGGYTSSTGILRQGIARSRQAGVPVIAEVGCGPMAPYLIGRAQSDPDSLYVGIDPDLRSLSDLTREVPLPPNALLFHGKAAAALAGTQVDQIDIIAPNGTEDSTRAQHSRLVAETGGPESYDDVLRTFLSALTILNSDLPIFLQASTGPLTITTEVSEWAHYLYSRLAEIAPNVTLKLYASEEKAWVLHQGAWHLCVKDEVNEDPRWTKSFWPSHDAPQVAPEHWASVINPFVANLVTEVWPKELAPPSSFFKNDDVVFELTARR